MKKNIVFVDDFIVYLGRLSTIDLLDELRTCIICMEGKHFNTIYRDYNKHLYNCIAYVLNDRGYHYDKISLC